ncbi:MAG: hypothetical protein HRU41_29660 [Saprospiraceae bacterium]|nr:hypothetical protein [Saprospiraceae bacterium]
MKTLRYKIRTNWAFYLLIISYAYLILNMTLRLWFGDGINIFATYSDAATEAEMLMDANKVYWSKTCFLFLTLLLYGLNFDYRFVVGTAASFWSSSLILMFGTSPVLLGVATLGAILLIQQIMRKEIRSA